MKADGAQGRDPTAGRACDTEQTLGPLNLSPQAVSLLHLYHRVVIKRQDTRSGLKSSILFGRGVCQDQRILLGEAFLEDQGSRSHPNGLLGTGSAGQTLRTDFCRQYRRDFAT